jgi:membrane peptidoglycan carboxypeptidase
MAAAYAAVANDGVRVAPHLVREVRDAEGRAVARPEPESHRVISAETAQVLRRMMEEVTLKGTARAAQLDGYTAAGKTGTAQKIDPKTRAYSQTKYVASFVGFAPIENPAVVIIVVIDEAVGLHQGGQVAAPVFSAIANQVLPYLEVTPDQEPGAKPSATGQLAAATGAAPVQPTATGAGPAVEDEGAAPAAPALPVVSARGDGVVVYAAATERSLLMPDLRGRSVREAARICERLGLELEARGEGRALRQSPEVGSAVASGQVVHIEFGRSD